MNREQKKTSVEIYSDIVDALIENEINEHSTPRQFLESKGVDVDSLLDGGMEIVNRWKSKARLQARRRQYENLRSRVSEVFSQLAQESTERLRERLVDLVAGDNKEVAAAYWHKLEELTDSDLQDMLKEQKLLQHLIQVYEDIESDEEN